MRDGQQADIMDMQKREPGEESSSIAAFEVTASDGWSWTGRKLALAMDLSRSSLISRATGRISLRIWKAVFHPSIILHSSSQYFGA